MPYRRSGTAKWWITVGGVRKSSGTEDEDDAKALEAKLNHQLWRETVMGVEPAHSWDEAVLKYVGEKAHKPSIETIKQRLRWWAPHLGKVADLTTIKRDTIDKLLHKHREITPLPSSANTTSNKYAIVVGAVLNAACREWGWTKSSPKLRRYPEPDHRRAFLRVEGWLRLEAELPEHLRHAATFALATGLRASKVFGLEWSQVDFRNRSLKTTGNSVKRGVVIPLNRTAMAVLAEIQASPMHHIKRVFCFEGRPLNDYGKAWFKAMDRAGLGEYRQWETDDGKKHTEWTGFCWHGLRHTFASWLGQSGASEMVIDQLCGWAEKDTRSIYTHLDTEHLRPFAEAIDEVLKTTVQTQFATQSTKNSG